LSNSATRSRIVRQEDGGLVVKQALCAFRKPCPVSDLVRADSIPIDVVSARDDENAFVSFKQIHRILRHRDRRSSLANP
jgi:hypothetical protein